MNGPLRILLISNKCPPDVDGGFEQRAFQVAKALRARGHQVDFVTSRYRPTFHGERGDPEWVHRIFHFVMVSQVRNWWRAIDRLPRRVAMTTVARENVPAMERFLEGREYDVAYCFGLHQISLAVAAPLVARGTPILWHAGDDYLASHLFFWPKTLPGYRLALQLFARKIYATERGLDYRHVAFVSEFLREDCARMGFKPACPRVISRGIDFPLGTDVERPRTAPPVFFMACRIHTQKGVHHAITAAEMLSRKRPDLDWRLEIAGVSYTGYRAELERRIQQSGLGGRIAFAGQMPQQEVLARMRDATAFLSCSTFGDPFAGTIIETLACGTPLIASDAGSALEVVEPEVSGLVYEKENPGQLAAHMERVLDDPALARRIAAAGVRVIAERYTLDRIIDRTEATLAEVIAAGPYRK